MRILRVAQKCFPDVTGGGAYHVHAMSRDQAAMGHDVTVLTVRYDEDLPREEAVDGYTIRRYPPSVRLLGNDVSSGLARALFAADEYDVVHAHSHLYAATNLAAMRRRLGGIPLGAVRRRLGTPLSITNHGLFSQSVPQWLFWPYLRTFGRATLNAADLVFCYTDADRERLRALGVGTDVAVVPNGIDETRFTPDGPESEAILGDGAGEGDEAGAAAQDGAGTGPVALFVGRLVDGKRPGDALAAFETLSEAYPGLRLVLAGDGPRRGDLEEWVAARGLQDRVAFLGEVPYEEMPALYRAADVFVLPSEAEGVPRTVLEALATGTPVVTSKLEQLRELSEHGVEQVPVGDVDALAAALDGLLVDEEERAEAGEQGRAIVEERYTWQDTVAQTTERLEALTS